MAPITINNVRASYVNVLRPQARPGQEPKYSVTCLLPKTDLAGKAAIDAAIGEAVAQGVKSKWNGQQPPSPNICIHDGDGPRPSDGMPFGPECKGMWVFTASCKENQPPFVVDGQLNNIIDPRVVYSGMWANVNVSFFPYNSNGKKGIGCALNGIQKVRDDEPLSNHVTAESAFSAIPAAPAAAAPGYGVPAAPAAPAYGQAAAPAAPAYGQPAAPAAPAYGQPAAPAQAAPTYGQPAAPAQAAPTYGQPAAPHYQPAAPRYQPAAQPQYDPITGQIIG